MSNYFLMKKKTIDLCKVVIGFESVPVSIDKGGTVYSVSKVDELKNKLLDNDLVKELSLVVPHDHVVIIAHKNVADRF